MEQNNEPTQHKDIPIMRETAFSEKKDSGDSGDSEEIDQSDETIDIHGRAIVYEPYKHLKPHQFKPGQSGNPSGKPKGKSLKEFTRDYILSLSNEEKLAFLQGMDKIDLWQMAEGKATEDKNVSIIVPKPILGGLSQQTDKNEALNAPTSPSKLESDSLVPLIETTIVEDSI